jgi:bifunctional UDP-N-acetylglucosamine pyrophosphorylase/glucosamine-1-phosphate N-acetyltransferase
MNSDLPKVLHKIHNKPLLEYVLKASSKVPKIDETYVIIGHQGEKVIKAFEKRQDLIYVEQTHQLGTGHAVMQLIPYLQDKHGSILILCGDTPLLSTKSLENLLKVQKTDKASAVVMTANLEHPFHYGRIIRANNGSVLGIREYRDCSEEDRLIKEINSGVYCFDIQDLIWALQHLKPENDQQEYYLTDTLEVLKHHHKTIAAWQTNDPDEISGINTLHELEEVGRKMVHA